MFVLGGKSTSIMFKNSLNQELKLMVEDSGINLYTLNIRFIRMLFGLKAWLLTTPLVLRTK